MAVDIYIININKLKLNIKIEFFILKDLLTFEKQLHTKIFLKIY
jgi:hypothetical protein